MSRRPDWPAEVLAWVGARDGYRCHICGLGFVVEDPWEIDHVAPYRVVRRHRLSNLRLAHKSCNRAKAAT